MNTSHHQSDQLISNREHEVLQLIAFEKTSKEIASDLYICPETVNSHRRNIMSKLKVKNTAGMVRVGMEKGVVGAKSLHLTSGIQVIIMIMVLWVSGSSDLIAQQNCNSNTALKWSTFQGANGADEVVDVYVHPTTKNIYSIARTTSTNTVASNGDLGLGGVDKTFIQCMNNNGTLIWSTLISGWNTPHSIFADDNENVILFGQTAHSQLPMSGAGLDKVLDGSSDMVYFKLDPTGASIISSSYIGGNGYEHIKGLNTNVDFYNDKIYGVVSTSSTDIVTSSNALSNTVGEAFIFSYDYGTDDYAYRSYYDYSGSGPISNFENAAGTESVNVDQYGNVYLILWNSSNDYTQTNNYITPNAIISDFTISDFNFPPLLIVLDDSYNQTYGSYITNIIDNAGSGPFSGCQFFDVSIVNGTPGVHNWHGFDIDVAEDGSIYILQNARGFRGPVHQDLSGALSTPMYIGPNPISTPQGCLTFSIGSNIIKLSQNSLSNFQVAYVHHFAYGDGGNPNQFKFEIDQYEQINLITTTSRISLTAANFYLGNQSINYSEPFVQSSGLTSFTIFEKESDEILYHVNPSDDPHFTNPSGRLYDLHLSDDDIYLFGRTISPTYPTTPSYRNQDLNQQVFTQQPDYASGDSDGFITVLHSPIPIDDNTIKDFDPLSNTFCTDSYIHQNYSPIDGSSISWLSGDGSQSNHIVPDFKKGNTITSHPIQYNSSFIQWQKSYDNINWVDIPGAVQEDYSPLPEALAGNVHYRRVYNSCSSTVESNIATAIISGNNDMTIDVGPSPYQHCTGSNTALTITITGGSGDVSWQWFNGYATTTDINPSSGISTNGIVAEVISTVDGGGVYRIVVTDNNTGCEVETLVTVRDPSANLNQQYYLCPGQTTCVDIGPSFTDPDIAYSWVGPNGYTSNVANICVTDIGIYTLILNGCPSTSVSTELIQNPHDPNLTTIPDYIFCQFDASTVIGMTTSTPSGYTFQWAPTQNISDITAFNPTYNPILEFQSNPQNYTFTALRQIDGCVYEEDLDITINKLVDVNGISSTSFCTGSDNLDLIDFEGSHVEWEITGTTFPGGLPGLQSDPLFSFDGSNQLIATSISPLITYPQLSSTAYTITIEIEGSSIPLPNNCSASDVIVLDIYESCNNSGGCTSCPPASCNWSINANIAPGTDGLCSGANQLVTLGPSISTNTYDWSIISIDDIPVSGSPLIGIFDQTGTLLTLPGPHPNAVIFDIDNPSPGAYDNIEFEMTTTSVTGIICKSTIKVYSADIYGPIVDLIPDFETCDIGNSVLQSGTSIPLTVDGSFYNSAPNSNINWTWSGPGVIDRATPFPTFSGPTIGIRTATATDILSGCKNSDQITINVNDVSAGAGADITDVCSGSIVQLDGPIDNPSNSYIWTPPVGLNFPIGTPNNMTPSPFAIVDQNITYILETTAPGCSTEDQMMITTSTAPPPNHPDQNYNACTGDMVQIVLDPSFLQGCAGCSYNWTHVSGGSIGYLNSTTVAQPIVSVPNSQVGNTIQYQLESTKGSCGSDIMLVTITLSVPSSPQIPQSLSIDCGLPLSAIDITNHVAGNQYEWSPIIGLYQDANMTIPLLSSITSLSSIYAYTNTNQNYNVMTLQNGCYSSVSSISVTNNNPLVSDAGTDVELCSGANSSMIGTTASYYSGSTIFNWAASGISPDPYSNSFVAPTAAEESDMLSWLSDATILNPTFQQVSYAAGSYEYTLTTQDGNCTHEDKMIIRVLNNNFPSGFAGQSQNKCVDDCFYLLSNPDPDYSYTWIPFPASEVANMTFSYSNNPLVCPQVDVTYSVYMTENSTGCTSDTEYVTYTMHPSPIIDDQFIEICQNNITLNLTSYVPNYSSLINPIWIINDGSGTVVTNPTNYLVLSDVEFVLSGENQYGCVDEGVIAVERPPILPATDSFYKIIGDANDNISKKVKFFDDHIIISYDHYVNGLPHASIIKYDRLGNMIWHTTMDYVSSLNDFIQDEDCQILAVGYKGEFSNTVDNESLILRIDNFNGAIISSTVLENNGREELKKIIRKSVGSNNSYYITGTRNPSPSSPNSVDLTCLYHYRLNGSFPFDNYYTNDLTQLDEEGDRGLLELSDGNILIFGNDGPTGLGLIMKIDGLTGDFIDGMFTNEIIDFYDAVQTSSGDIVVVGEKFNADEGCIVVIDASLNIISSSKFDNITDFREIKHTTGTNYLIAGKAKNTERYPVLFSVDYNVGVLSSNTGYYINSFETDYNTFWFDYDVLNNKVAYSDTRTGNPNGYGMKDILVGIFDPSLTTICSQSYTPNMLVDNVNKTTESFGKYPFGLTISTAPNTVVIPIQEKSNICGCEDNAISFDGSNDFLHTNGFSTNSDFSISLWFNAHSTPNGGAEDRIVSFGPNNRLEIGIQEGGPFDGELWVYDGNRNNVQTFGTNVRDGEWHHIVFVRTGLNSEMYLDGSILGSYSPTSSNQYGPNFAIGRWTGGPASTHFKGLVDEVSIWNTALSSADAASLYGCSLDGTEYGLVSLYKMNQGFSGGDNTMINQVTDLGTGANDLALTNFTLNGSVSNFVCSSIGLAQACTFCSALPIAICQQNPTFSFDPLTDQLILDVSDIDDGSNSVCNSTVTLSFDANSIVPTITFDCPDDVGQHLITLYVNDSNGLQSSCTTTIEIESNNLDIAALHEFYYSTGGDLWNNNTGWLTNCDPCGLEAGNDPWFGIACSVDRITQIALTSNNLTGSLPASINDLEMMSWFDVSRNLLVGDFPDIYNWLDLKFLKLGNLPAGGNLFDNCLPSYLGDFPDLIEVLAEYAGFCGTLPNFDPITQQNLVNFDLEGNNLTGSIPVNYGEFNWNSLDISHNNLDGCYDYLLYSLLGTNADISDGNSFDAPWDDFLSSGDGFCCVVDLVLPGTITSGYYSSSGTITFTGTILAGANVIFDAPIVILDPISIIDITATVTVEQDGCIP